MKLDLPPVRGSGEPGRVYFRAIVLQPTGIPLTTTSSSSCLNDSYWFHNVPALPFSR